MLSDRFDTAVDHLQQQAQARQTARNARDAFIVANWPVIDAAFAAMIANVTGVHPRLAVVSTLVTDVFTGHAFPTLDKTVTTVVSTLYGSPERVQFTPALESVDTNQFGVIRVDVAGFTPSIGNGGSPQGARFRSLLERGVILEGQDHASTSLKIDDHYEPLTAELLEGFLAALLVRTD